MITPRIPNLTEVLDPATIHVLAPSKAVLLCGGTYAAADNIAGVKIPPRSLRDAFYRVSINKPFDKFKLLIPDDIVFGAPTGPYDELLEFERDLAQLCELVILFTESEGSFAELGAFSVTKEIAPRILVIIDDKNHEDSSFIKLGPVFSLRKHQGRQSVFVMKREDIGIRSIRDIKDIDISAFSNVLSGPFQERLDVIINPTTFDPDRRGHLGKLVAGLLHHYGALTSDEVFQELEQLGWPQARQSVDQLLFCLCEVGWIVADSRGFDTFYAYASAKSSWTFKHRPGNDFAGGDAWRLRIRGYWRTKHTSRFAAIQTGIRMMQND